MTSDTGTIGARGKSYVAGNGYRLVIVVNETCYDAGYDCYYDRPIVINKTPTPAEIFKIRLANPQ